MKSDYDESYFKDRGFEDKDYNMVLQWIELLKLKDAFDYGCGKGYFVHALNYFGVPSRGFDISSYAITNAYGFAVGNVSMELDVQNNYDLVTCIDVMEHIPVDAEEEVINNLTKLTKRYLLLSICDTTLRKRYVDKTHVNIRPRKYWEDKFIKKGFKKLSVPRDWHFAKQLYLFEKVK